MQTLPPARFLDRTTPPHVMTLISMAGMSALVLNVFLPSLPAMAAHFNTSYAVMQLSIPVYFFFSAILQLIIGPISDSLGRRKVMMGGIALFLLATLGCVFAPSVEIFLIFRLCQATIAVAMVLSRAIIRDMVAREQAASMIGYVTMGMALVPMISPMIGGALQQLFGWQANFWLQFGLGAALLLLIFLDQGETGVKSDKSIWRQFGEYPEILRSPRFWGYSLAAAFCSGSFFAYLGGAPFIGTAIFGMEPFWLGIALGAPAIGYFIGNFLTARFATRFGINQLVLWGSLANVAGSGISLLIMTSGHGSPLTFFGMMTLVGVGNGLCIPNATAGMLEVRPHLAGTASGLGGAIMIAGGAVLAMLAGAVLSPESGASPVLWIMSATASLGVLAILFVIWREKKLGL